MKMNGQLIPNQNGFRLSKTIISHILALRKLRKGVKMSESKVIKIMPSSYTFILKKLLIK